jgi:hypothetical protein
MEEWKDGRVEGWKSGRVEEWKGGRVEGWSRASVFRRLVCRAFDWRSIHTSLVSYSVFVSLMTKLSSHVPVSFFFCRLSIKRFKPFSSLKAIASRCSMSTSAICLAA